MTFRYNDYDKPGELTVEKDGAVLDVTGDTIDMMVRIDGNLTFISTCTHIDSPNGRVNYYYQVGHVPRPATYKACLRRTTSGGMIEHSHDFDLYVLREASE